jgi:ubiquitin carboxyl-terminal hydrolase 4/11/15
MQDVSANGDSVSISESNTSSNPESTATSLSGANPSLTNAPSLDEQVSKVFAICHKELVESQEGYVVPNKWLQRVFARTSENVNKPGDFDKAATEGEIGLVNTLDLVDTGKSRYLCIQILHTLMAVQPLREKNSLT